MSVLRLSPLSREDTAALVRTLARTDEADVTATAARAEQIWAISEGNPFMTVEAVHALQEESTTLASTQTLYLPARIREVITRRLERLSARGQELAAVAAVIGREFEFALLQRAAGMAEREAAQGVEELVRRRVLHGVGERFDFTHDRIREAVVSGLLAPRRRLLHGQVAVAIEDLYASRPEPYVTALGLHYMQAEAWDKASSYLFQAGEAARSRSAQREAVVFLNHALEAVDRLPRSRSAVERAIDIRIELDFALGPFPERGLILDHLREAERLAVEIGDHRRRGTALAFLANEWWSLSHYDAALDAGERALAIGTALGDAVIKVRARSILGRTHHSLGNLALARSLFEENLEDLARDAERASRMFNYFGISHVRLAQVLSELGEFARGLACLEETAQICQTRQNWWGVIHVLNARGLIHHRRGDFQAAVVVQEEALQLCCSRDFPALIPYAAANLGYAYARTGRLAEGSSLIEQSLRDSEPLVMTWAQALWSVLLSEAHLLAGRLGEAATVGRRALDLAEQRKERGQEAYAERLLGEIASHADRRDIVEAEQRYRRAASLAEELRMRPLLAHCHFGLGKLYQAVRNRQEAHEHLVTATTMYSDLDMGFWLEQAADLASR